MMFERTLLVLNLEEEMRVFEVREGCFRLFGRFAPNETSRDIVLSQMQQGYTRVVSVEPDDGVSGLYQRKEAA